jgi:hypothetical protein
MNALWSYFWPAFTIGLLVGVLTGMFAFRRRAKRVALLAAGSLLSIAAAALWHGPFGAAHRFTTGVERIARQALVDYDAPAGITAQVHHGPLTRDLILSGPANDFQRAEAARLLGQIPGVSRAVWTPRVGVPLIGEGAAVALAGFLLGLLLAYLVELRRRYNAQWNW